MLDINSNVPKKQKKSFTYHFNNVKQEFIDAGQDQKLQNKAKNKLLHLLEQAKKKKHHKSVLAIRDFCVKENIELRVLPNIHEKKLKLHPKVEPTAIQENGKLYTDEDIILLNKYFQDKSDLANKKLAEILHNKEGKYTEKDVIFCNQYFQGKFDLANKKVSKQELNKTPDKEFKYSVIYANNNIYAVYLGEKHNKHLGKDAFGKVKLMQNLRTGEWLTLKVQNVSNNTEENNKRMADFEKEFKNLGMPQINQAEFLVQKGGKKNNKHMIGMKKLFEGQNAHDSLVGPEKITPPINRQIARELSEEGIRMGGNLFTRPDNVSTTNVKKCTDRLDAEINRLKNKYTDYNTNPTVSKRIEDIETYKTMIQSLDYTQDLTIDTLGKHLKVLEKKMFNTGFGFFQSTGEKNINQLRKEVENLNKIQQIHLKN